MFENIRLLLIPGWNENKSYYKTYYNFFFREIFIILNINFLDNCFINYESIIVYNNL